MVDPIHIMLMISRPDDRDPWECDWTLLDLVHLEAIQSGRIQGRAHWTRLDVARSGLSAAFRHWSALTS